MIITILRRTALGLVATAAILSTPVLGIMGLGAWQQYDPASFRAVIHQASALTEVEDADQMYGNFVALFEPGIAEQRG